MIQTAFTYQVKPYENSLWLHLPYPLTIDFPIPLHSLIYAHAFSSTHRKQAYRCTFSVNSAFEIRTIYAIPHCRNGHNRPPLQALTNPKAMKHIIMLSSVSPMVIRLVILSKLLPECHFPEPIVCLSPPVFLPWLMSLRHYANRLIGQHHDTMSFPIFKDPHLNPFQTASIKGMIAPFYLKEPT